MLIAGGELLIRGSVGVARWLKLPPSIVGLTVVAFGTSAPELIVAIEATIEGSPDIVTGNVIGSNIANVLLVLGAAALIAPIKTEMRMINRDGLFMIGASAFLAGICLTREIGLFIGLGMIGAYLCYIGYSYWSERIAPPPQQVDATGSQEPEPHKFDDDTGDVPTKPLLALGTFLVGLVGLLWGADLLVDVAARLARSVGVSEAVIGLTIVALGTSLPELTAAVIAALRGQSALALGNVVGSNITNILLILGVAGTVAPLQIAAQIARLDVWVMLAVSVVLIPVLVSGRVLSRVEAVFFLVCYGVYTFALYTGWPQHFVS